MLAELDGFPTEKLGFAELDHHRALRLGHPEAVLCEGKTTAQLLDICAGLAGRGEGFLATRATDPQLRALRSEFPGIEVSPTGRIAHLPAKEDTPPNVRGRVLILTAGTSDLPIAEEARVAARAYGNPVDVRLDVGVAGLHRILTLQDELRRAAVIIVAAGMDGALPSVVAGMVPTPVIALPTSRGYGAALRGFTPLLTMLTSCAPGLTVVNIDNGYGAACAATRINQHLASCD